MPVLLVLALVIYFPRMNALGVYAWQEGQRLIVAREMNQRLSAASSLAEAVSVLLTPTVHSVAYIAKPPVFYWVQIMLARLTGGEVELVHTRLAAALSGLLGVIATYFCARQILKPERSSAQQRGFDNVLLDDSFARAAAFWAGVCVAISPLFAYAARIGEVDILLTAFCTLAIACFAAAWRRAREGVSAPWSSVVVGALSATLATHTKDPGVLIVGLASLGAILLHAAWSNEPGQVAGRRVSRAAMVLPGVIAIAAGVFGARHGASVRGVIGSACIAAMVGGLALTMLRFVEMARVRVAWRAVIRSRVVVFIATPIIAAAIWRWYVGHQIGPTNMTALVEQEVGDNLRVLIADAPLNNLEGLFIGTGLAGGLLVFALVWWIKDRPRLPASWWIVIAWIALGLCAFSLLGKGVQRYLTPLWPGVAIVGGLTITSLLAAHPRARWLRTALAIVVITIASVEVWHFAVQRVRQKEPFSPREIAAEIRSRGGLDPGRIVSINMSSPALAYYLGQRIESVGDDGVNSSMSGGGAMSPAELALRVGTDPPVYALAAAESLNTIVAEGLMAEPISLGARWLDSGKRPIHLYRLKVSGPPELRQETSPEADP